MNRKILYVFDRDGGSKKAHRDLKLTENYFLGELPDIFSVR